ncbi:MAG: non-canonical purine NTP pyrophosphatase [Crocinitomicaceae bacterium]|nr:non-canonical purine NTP pyrophosphatase [Crocinitomicaceae bacterium]|tara:strand:+ start:7617 stop:8201 length:585 start_codon:yes stop_codon:yes gene_type:complete
MKQIVFATNNQHKLEEVQSLLSEQFQIISLNELGFKEEIPETQKTIEGNASQKSHYIYERYNMPVFADDTGLEIDALNGEPGVYSARYAGSNCSFQDNCNKVLNNLKGEQNRNSRFKTVISLIIDGNEHQFEGLVNGKILEEGRGEDGFGYDSIFLPDGYEKCFAEMSLEEKNQISHRGLAVRKLVKFLSTDIA